jgi:hypothetical protein
MAQKSLKRVLQAAVLLMFSSSLLWRCANISSPQGGPKDSLPPIIVSAAPMFNTTEFKGNTITIGFDEYVVIKDQQKEFFTSPMMKRTPKLTTIGKTIRITILDTLAENQTYALNFGSSVVDNNEGNILSDLRYVFSTGREIDSMVMSGYTVSASKGDSVSKSLIFFYPAEVDSIPDYDSILFKHKPAVVARAANNGIFVAQNLKPIDYKIYAIQDNNNNYTYDPETDMVGFLDSVRNPLREPDFSVWYDTTRHYLTPPEGARFQRLVRHHTPLSDRQSTALLQDVYRRKVQASVTRGVEAPRAAQGNPVVWRTTARDFGVLDRRHCPRGDNHRV